MKGRITSCIAGVFKVYLDGLFYNCTVKKTLKKQKLLFVGDYVEFDSSTFVISDVFPSKNSLIRPAVNNLDEALIISSIVEPKFSKYLILKFICYFNYHKINNCVIFTKDDLLENNEDLQGFLTELDEAHIKYFVTSKFDNNTNLKIKNYCYGKTVLFCGQTGVGKSSLLNSIQPNFNRLIDDYSFSLNRGKHKTKENIILPLNEETFLVDSPGFSSLDLSMSQIAIRDNFPLISSYMNMCKFDNCLHINEPDCAVKHAIKIEEISLDWYNIYKELIEDAGKNT